MRYFFVPLKHLERLWPALGGAVSGTAMLSGTLEAPDIQGGLQLSQLGFEGGKLASGRARFRVAPLCLRRQSGAEQPALLRHRTFRVSAESGKNGTQMRLSGYISPNLMVRYGIGVFDVVNSLTLRYRLKGNLYLEATSGQANSLDLLWSFER